ncbi:MAG: sugar transferase [Bacteroidales bacterium]|nr:sugar transferase [Bacteroidales bacterium]
MNRKLQTIKYIIADWFSAFLAWTIFFIYRKYIFDHNVFSHPQDIYNDQNLYLGLIIIPVFWLLLYIISGVYRRIYRKSRIRELGQTLLATFIGVIFIFFTIILDDYIVSYKNYYQSFFTLFFIHFSITFLFRFILTSITAYKIHNRIIGFNTVIVGSNGNALKLYQKMTNETKSSGNKFVGFVNALPYKEYKLEKFLPHLGTYKDLNKIIKEYNIEEVIIAIEKNEKCTAQDIITILDDSNVIIKILPFMQDILIGSVKTTSIFDTPLIEVPSELMPQWQKTLKRTLDIIISIIAIIILLPVYIFTAIGVKASSKGPIIFSQERIGYKGHPFKMHKFRSMYCDAEKDGVPRLSSDNDNRITPFGKFLRKVRLDEIPQFFSVLKGDMSIVGPRPERQFFINQIIEKAPQYRLLHKIKPGITSWGQVKFGYASNVDEMIQRLKFDLLYLENMSIATDIRILIYTALIIIQGRGK